MNFTLTHCLFRDYNLKEEKEAWQDNVSVGWGNSREAASWTVMERLSEITLALSTVCDSAAHSDHQGKQEDLVSADSLSEAGIYPPLCPQN